MIWNDKKEVLLCLREDMNIWNLPGGWLDIWESPWEWIIRETHEETGFDIQISQLSGIYNKSDHKEILFAFVCEIVGGEAITTNECIEMRYFKADELPENLPRRHKEIVIDYTEDPDSLNMKHQ
jgi:8-oxo-dGTP diphosphatase